MKFPNYMDLGTRGLQLPEKYQKKKKKKDNISYFHVCNLISCKPKIKSLFDFIGQKLRILFPFFRKIYEKKTL